MSGARDLLAKKYKPSTATVRLLLDGELSDAIEAATAAIRKTEQAEARSDQGLVSDLPALRAKLAELQAQADNETTVFVLHAMPGAEFDAMKLAHPPTEQQWASYREQARTLPMFAAAPQFDADGMAPLLIAASVAEIDGETAEWDAADGQYFWDNVHDGARADLLSAAFLLNQKGMARPLSESDTAGTRSIAPPSTTRPDTESPSASLADG